MLTPEQKLEEVIQELTSSIIIGSDTFDTVMKIKDDVTKYLFDIGYYGKMSKSGEESE